MKKIILVSFLILAWAFLAVSISSAALCGNAIREGLEDCDNGANNCDGCPDACRTDCVFPRCGDYAVDSNEECDDWPRNSDEIPGACRTNCKKAHCGDGILDLDLYEECDDSNQDAFDGCHECRRCISLKDDLAIANREGQTLLVCPGNYEFEDKGQEGVIILNSPGMTFDCQGVIIRGASALAAAVSNSMPAASQAKVTNQPNRPFSKRAAKQKTVTESEPTSTPSSNPPVNPPIGPATTIRKGTGIVVAADNVVVRNCNITNFRTGIKVQSKGSVLLDNNVCKNQKDIVATQTGNYGVKNYCAVPNSWSEDGKPECTFSCP